MKDSFKNRLQLIMRYKGLRQTDVLKLCQPYCTKTGIRMGNNDISQYLSGWSDPKYDKVHILSLALGVSEAWLMGYDNSLTEDELISQSTNAEEIFSVSAKLFRLDHTDLTIVGECVDALLRKDKYFTGDKSNGINGK